MKIILMIPMILSIVAASMFIATISNDDKVFAVCTEMIGENQRTIHCEDRINDSSSNTDTTTSSNTDTTTSSNTDTTTPTITEEVEDEEPSPQDCMGLLCLVDGLIGPGLDTISNPLGDLGID